MQSVRLRDALRVFLEEAACALHAEVLGGAEVPFELEAQPGRRGPAGPALYSYRPLTATFIQERRELLESLPAHAEAARLLGRFSGLDRYLALAGEELPATAAERARRALTVLACEVFADQSDFELRPERLQAGLARVDQAALNGVAGTTVVATLHGMTICSPELQLTGSLRIARPDAIPGLPEAATAAGQEHGPGHLVAVLVIEEESPLRAAAAGRSALLEMLRALRLFGDGRVCLGSLGWSRAAAGGWRPMSMGSGGRPQGMLVVTPEQEDELRAFCNLVSRRTPQGEEVAWALRRFELGCERDSPFEALSDHLLALRALLEPEGPSSGMLPGRLAALCATPERRNELTERVLEAVGLERAVIAGTLSEGSAGSSLAGDVADHLRALLRDVICGHLDGDLAGLADEILIEASEPQSGESRAAEHSAEEVLGDPGESQEILDLSV
jgi:hypothetical protein